MSNINSGNIEEGESEVISNLDIDTMSVLDDPRVTAEEEEKCGDLSNEVENHVVTTHDHVVTVDGGKVNSDLATVDFRSRDDVDRNEASDY